jgi:hypothetical protein
MVVTFRPLVQLGYECDLALKDKLTYSCALEVRSIFVLFQMTLICGLLNPILQPVAQADVIIVKGFVLAY